MASRGIWQFMSARTRRGLALSWSALFVLSLLLQYFSFALASPALAVHGEGLFEVDGNALDQAPPEPDDDWNSLNHAIDSIFIPGSVEKDGVDTTYFTGGGSKDVNDISQWQYSANDVAPDKDEILDAFAAVYEKNGDTFVYFGADRFDGSGDAFIGFWFLQSNISLGANGSFNGTHVNGDILVLSDFTNGGSVAEIQVYEWINGKLVVKASSATCDVPGEEEACAAVNAATATAPWAFLDKSGSTNFAAGEFYEGGVNLDLIFGEDPPCFSTFIAETRSSASTSAQLKDFALGSLSTCVPPTLTTDASTTTWHFGDAGVTDTATLSGNDGPASGKVKFFICTPAQITAAGCPTGGTQIGVAAGVAVTTSANGGTATSTPAFVPTAAGKYCFRAQYVPDGNSDYLAASHTNATTECFTVVKNDTTITTMANQSVNVGAAIADTAVLAGATGDAGGTITFRAYGPGDDDCNGTAAFTSDPVAVSGNGSYGPVSFTPTTAGVYYWIATYSGDAKNAGSTHACGATGEVDTVGKLHPSINTVASASVIVGGTIHDTATLAGGHAPTGSITFNLYGPDDATCTGDVIFTDSVTVNRNGDYVSDAFTTTQAGTYRWIANYSGDANNTATANGCNETNESVIVNKTTPSITTLLVSGDHTGANISVALGSMVHDTSALAGATADAGGTVHYQVFSDDTCTTLFADAGTKDVVNGVPGDSDAIQFNSSGIYYWQADYSGDANNSAAEGDCTEETVSVGLSNPTISTNASASVLVGGEIHDTATLADGFNPTGSITFNLYGPDDATCAAEAIFSSTVAVDGNGDYVSGAYTATTAGVYRWVARYSGDGNNSVAAGSCNDANENVIVTTPDLDVVKLVATGDGVFGPTNVATPGSVVKYQITVTNSGDGVATNVPVSDDIAAILAHATYNNDCNLACNLVGSTLNWTLASIAAGDSVTLTFSVTLDESFPAGTTTLPNVVVVTGPGSNCPEASTDPDCTTTTTVTESILSIDKSFTGNTGGTDPDLDVPAANVGDTLTYTLHYTGEGPLTGTVISDVLPQGLAYIAGSGEAGDNGSDFDFVGYDAATRTLSWIGNGEGQSIPDPADGDVTYQVTVLATAPDFAQPLVNVATIDSDQTPPDSDTTPVAVLAPPLELTPPPTSTLTPQSGTGNPGFGLMLILIGVAGLVLGIGFVTPVPARVRRRDRLG
ncbi:MAG: hypothetical protein H0U52_00170 [Chloroflexi bacterium]|nr:hypothetical protein [Chloroflexota bacterium]